MNKIRIEAAALVVGLSLFLFSCEKEVSGRGSGRKVAINFTVANEGYGVDQEILKGAGVKDLRPETRVIPLKDNYYMSATLVPEPAEETAFDGSQLRAAAAFTTGQKIRFMAFNGTTEVGSAIYTWNGSKFVPDGEPLGVEADNEVMYHFVAYSFFGDPLTEPDDEDVEAGILPAQDLVWGERNQKVYDNLTDRTVPILMKHKFSRVRVKVDASSLGAQVTNVSGVVIAGGKKADLTVRTGSLAASSAAGADLTATVTNWVSVDDGEAMQSGSVLFYPSVTTITLAAIDLEIDDDPVALMNKSVTFSQALAENTSYTVVVDVRTNRWAYSNIYWDQTLNEGAGALTFDRTLVDVEHQYYNGVLFKWGSLVGISPVGAPVVNNSTPVDMTQILTYTPLSGGGWDATKTAASWGGWESISYQQAQSSTYASDENFLYDLGVNLGAYTGDICNYIHPYWRIPNATEASGYTSYGALVSDGHFNLDAAGTGLIMVGRYYYYPFGFWFVARTYLREGFSPSGGGTVTNGQFFWTGSDYYLQNNLASLFGSALAYMRAAAFTIRCIKKLPTD
jgi:hypothetical protein